MGTVSRPGDILIDGVVIPRFCGKYMRCNAQTLRFVQAASGNRHSFPAFFFEKQAGTAGVTESSSKSGYGAEPTQGVLLIEGEILFAARGCGNKMAAAAPALLAVTGDDVAQRACHCVANAAT